MSEREDIDINDPRLAAETVDTDQVSGEEFLGRRLPDDGTYNAQASFGQNKHKIKPRTNKDGKEEHFLTLHLALTLLDEGEPTGVVVFDWPNSVVYEKDGKKSSKVHSIMDFVGAPVPPGEYFPVFAQKVIDKINEKPIIGVVVQWQASSAAQSEDEISKAIKLGFIPSKKAEDFKVGHYYTFLKGQKNFPSREDGSYSQEVQNPITGELVQAQAQVANYKRAARARVAA